MQLLPQHFQLQDRRSEALVRHAGQIFDIGFDRIEWDAPALTRGVVSLRVVSGRFADMSSFFHDEDHGAALELDLKGIAACDTPEGLVIALCMPTSDFVSESGRTTRWVDLPGEPIADAHNPEESAVVVRQRPALGLRAYEPQNRQWLQLPLLQVRRRGSQYESLGIHPPARRLLPDTRCAQELQLLLAAMRARVEQFAAALGTHALTPEGQYRCERVLLNLTGELLHLECLIGDSLVHPYEFHRLLCVLGGRMAALAGQVPPMPPRFDIMNPHRSIAILCDDSLARLRTLEVVRRRYTEIPLVLKNDVWTAVLPPSLSRSSLFLVRFSAPPNESAWLKWLDAVVVCQADQLQRVRGLRIRGLVRRAPTRSPELGIDPAPAERLLEIDVGEIASSSRSVDVAFSAPGMAIGTFIESIHLVISANAETAESNT